jgi:DHA1 family tetracycline resistance protein-like MFS transporter
VTTTEIQHRYLLLVALRWLPTGLLIPVLVLLMLDRGLTLGQIGLATAAQGVMILLLELPTGGLADAVGRRNVLVVASGFDLLAVAVMISAGSLGSFALVFALQGIARALMSGPLDAWYVDAVQLADPEANIERGLANAGVVVGVSIAAGTLLASGVVALDPLPHVAALATPLVIALALRLVEVTAIWNLMVERDRNRRSLGDSMREVPDVVRRAVRTVRQSHMLGILMTIEALWGFGMTAFELLTPAKLGAVSGDATGAARLVGPMTTAGWVMGAVGAAAVPTLVRRVGAPLSGCWLLAAQSVFIAGIALASGPAGVIVAFVMTMTTHGAANPVHQGLVHRAVAVPELRASVLSTMSLAAMAGGMLGGIVLGALAEATTLTTAFVVGALTVVGAALLYLAARRVPALGVDSPHPVRSGA